MTGLFPALVLPLTSKKLARCVSLRLSHAGKLLLALLMAGSVSGCGGGYFAHPVESYSVTITATSGPLPKLVDAKPPRMVSVLRQDSLMEMTPAFPPAILCHSASAQKAVDV
jgi:hypothetical protein